MALNLLKMLKAPWEVSRDIVRMNLDAIETAFNQVTAAKPHLVAFNSTAQEIASNTWVQLVFDSVLGTDVQSRAILQSRGILTVPAAGRYWLDARGTFEATSGATLARGIKLTSGSDILGTGFFSNDDDVVGASVSTSSILDFNAGDQITCWVYQNSGTPVNIGFTTDIAFQTRITLSQL